MREGRGFRKRDKKKPQSLVYQDFGVVAEKEGFEPSKRFCRLHDFQSCALDQLGDFSIAVPVHSADAVVRRLNETALSL